MIVQKSEWLAWPPPLLRTAARLSSGIVVEQRQDALERLAVPFGPLQRLVQVVDVGLVMFPVVDLHRPGVDRRLERVVAVRKWGELVGHAFSFGLCPQRYAPRRTRGIEERHGACVQPRGDHAPRAEARAAGARRHLTRDRRGALQALPGVREQAERDPRKLGGIDLTSANQVYSELRSLKVDLTFAIGGIKNHEIYFEHLGGRGGEPAGLFGDLVKRDFGSVADWKADLKATGLAGRGWAWTAYDWDESRLFNWIGDAQNSFPVWNATPLVALDVYEHAYFVDFGTDRGGYIEAFFNNLDYDVVNDWVHQYGIKK